MPGKFGQSLIDLSNFLWGTPLLILLFIGGVFFFIYSRLKPLRYISHAVAILRGKYDKSDEPGQISHYQALSTALAGTVGMGNISGVALAMVMGGPGTIFWMWISALLGMMTKYFTCTLAVMFRGYDSKGELQGGPMYFIVEGLGKNWKPLAVFFSLVAMVGVSPMFQANQLTQAFVDIALVPNGVKDSFTLHLIIGICITVIVALVVFGGIKRIGKVAGRLVPVMVILYILSVLSILFLNSSEIIPSFRLIFQDAFTGKAVMGGALGSLIIMGFRRAAFSNEAGIGTAPMAHGAAKTKEPVREGLVAMLGPFIDTIIVCTMTALAIIITGVWKDSSVEGISLTAKAFEIGIPFIGKYILIVCVTIFALTTLFAFPYYGTKAFSFVFGAEYGNIYKYLYVASISLGAVSSLKVVISIFDSAYALMAFPTMLSAILLSPHVVKETKKYFHRYKNGEFDQNK
ncbi:MAG: alanine:cation symporter family protein [Bacteroidales bacterium]|nr:alanine:cation symporter family protein [Bacteroidales bacterium]MCF8390786.1 alanine:cation symporter family protein [Bacteroidales bacterium]